ncbi:hypothetical protein Scel_10030 [Streptomyces cellostaticus]|nr:hypothetical protein Scel_10030 [Streptomyces cellostaticus]
MAAGRQGTGPGHARPRHPAVAPLPRAHRTTLHLTSCAGRLDELTRFCRWRIDYQIATPGLAARAAKSLVERAATHAERWSDHAPVTVEYDHTV